MKKIVLSLLVLTALLFSGCATGPGKTGLQSDVLESLVPADSTAFVRFSSIKTLYDRFMVTTDSVMGQPLGEPELQQMKERLGLNALDLKELESHGVEPTAPCGLSFFISSPQSQGDPELLLTFYIPATDSRQVLQLLNNSLAKNSGKVREEEGATISVNGKETVISFDAEGYAILIVADNLLGNPLEYVQKIRERAAPLGRSQQYLNLASKLDSRQDLFAYLDMSTLMPIMFNNLLEDQDQQEPTLVDGMKELAQYGLGMDFSGKDLKVRSATSFDPASKVLTFYQEARNDPTFVQAVPLKPLLYMSGKFDIPQFYRLMKEYLDNSGSDQTLSQGVEQFPLIFGIDLEKDVVENFAGGLNLALYMPDQGSMLNNAFMSLTVKDDEVMKGVLNSMFNVLAAASPGLVKQENLTGVETHVVTIPGFFDLCFAVSDGSLLMSTGKTVFKQAVSGRAAGGFSLVTDNKQLSSAIRENEFVFYVALADFFETLRKDLLIKPFFPQSEPIGEAMTAVSHIKYLLSTSNLGDGFSLGNMEIVTDFKNRFIEGLVELFQEFKGAESADAERSQL